MILYLDTSCFAKIYVTESGTDAVKDAIRKAEIVATSLVAYPEMRSALSRRKREGALNSSIYQSIVKSFKHDWNNLSKVVLNESLIEDAGNFTETHALRGLDAIHLACAVFLKRKSRGISVVFLSSDEKLNSAAQKEGLKLSIGEIS